MPLLCRVINLGIQDYWEVYQYQKDLVQAKANAKHGHDTLILVEHPPVFTIGKSGSRENLHIPPEHLEEKGIAVYEIDRGGDITYHGPGQLVGYPILNLERHGKDLHKLIWKYEEVIIRTLAGFGIAGLRLEQYPGVWVGEEKIAALGIGVSKWIAYHGFALNVNPNLSHFKMITPCGIHDKSVTSLELLLGHQVKMEEVTERLVQRFGEVFNMEMRYSI
ncbi:MAG: lipoyl(octanoyl) transferase LipB [Clostridia bacterium]|nr:lipoyl(octanoyl) transferase LipB [Clostridia bacterium]